MVSKELYLMLQDHALAALALVHADLVAACRDFPNHLYYMNE